MVDISQLSIQHREGTKELLLSYSNYSRHAKMGTADLKGAEETVEVNAEVTDGATFVSFSNVPFV